MESSHALSNAHHRSIDLELSSFTSLSRGNKPLPAINFNFPMIQTADKPSCGLGNATYEEWSTDRPPSDLLGSSYQLRCCIRHGPSQNNTDLVLALLQQRWRRSIWRYTIDEGRRAVSNPRFRCGGQHIYPVGVGEGIRGLSKTLPSQFIPIPSLSSLNQQDDSQKSPPLQESPLVFRDRV